jgi:hypothetical protein
VADIHIPPAALEAGARAAMDDAGWHWDSADEARRDIWRRTASAAFLAMIEAWPGMGLEYRSDNPRFYNGNLVILPLPQEASDDQ